VKGLREELARVGITGRLARRIELELEDHALCDPAAPLGSPQLIAERFAEELRLPRTRRAVHSGFLALALVALGLAFLRPRTLPNGHASALVVALTGLAIVLGAQVSFVGGSLALWGVHRGTQLRTVQRRILVALGAGALVVAGESLDLAFTHSRPWWYALAVLPAFGLAYSGSALRNAAALTPAAGRGPVAFTRSAVVAIGAGAAVVVAVGSAFAERSWAEGLTRGVLEAVAFAGCFVLLGRRLGIRR
jgi:hypothetical protein